ncbi:uncharacterized protein A4U43_C08F32210 [Asparagus officinalis]|nr:uncharacterized protein A4U43_C08F32210 [Asparagus officinalis]
MSMGDYDIDIFLAHTNNNNASLFIEPPLSPFGEVDLSGINTPTITTCIKPNPQANIYPPLSNNILAHMQNPPPSKSNHPINIPNNIGSCSASKAPINVCSQNFPFNDVFRPFTRQNALPYGVNNPIGQSQSFLSQSLPPHQQPFFPNGNIITKGKELTPSTTLFPSQDLLIDPRLRNINNQNLRNNNAMEYPLQSLINRQTIPINLATSYDFTTPLPEIQGKSLINLYSQKKSMKLMRPMENFDNHDPEAIASFLAGQVRPGPNAPRIYKCEICSLEFPSAQAIGGHMTSHCSRKKAKKCLKVKGGKNKKTNKNSKKSVTGKLMKSAQ